mmetsp:Transcript_28880/g.60098  ORF Transcript_28880/g.60098 Transcript_28880/m.60098 type:complete len:208 (+) Transcript_28880:69-692(+)
MVATKTKIRSQGTTSPIRSLEIKSLTTRNPVITTIGRNPLTRNRVTRRRVTRSPITRSPITRGGKRKTRRITAAKTTITITTNITTTITTTITSLGGTLQAGTHQAGTHPKMILGLESQGKHPVGRHISRVRATTPGMTREVGTIAHARTSTLLRGVDHRLGEDDPRRRSRFAPACLHSTLRTSLPLLQQNFRPICQPLNFRRSNLP